MSPCRRRRISAAYLALRKLAAGQDEAELPDLYVLSGHLGCSRTTLRSYVAEMIEEGWLAVERRLRRPSVYRFLRAATQVAEEADPRVMIPGPVILGTLQLGGQVCTVFAVPSVPSRPYAAASCITKSSSLRRSTAALEGTAMSKSSAVASSGQGSFPQLTLIMGDPSPEPVPANVRQVDDDDVTPGERRMASEILGIFNEVGGFRFRSREFVAKIVRRVREHPEMTVEEHRAVIEHALSHPWWRKAPTPCVIYGNETQFDRTLNAYLAAEKSKREGPVGVPGSRMDGEYVFTEGKYMASARAKGNLLGC